MTTPPRTNVCLLLAAMSLALGGCIGHNNIEPISGATAFENPNEAPVPQAMTTALRWVIERYPPNPEQPIGSFPSEPIAVNLPTRMRFEMARKVARDVAPNVTILTQENQRTLPVYHVGRVWVRGDAASVDVFRPVSAFGASPGGQPTYQAITVNLRAGFAPWRVTAHRVWPVGTLDLPLLTFPSPRPAPGMNVPSEPESPPAAETFPNG